MQSRTYEIKEVADRARKIKSFLVDFNADVKPGQFFMVWVPGFGEMPLSASHSSGEEIEFTVRAVGKASNAMHELKEGDFIGVRGPYGNNFEIKGNKVAIVSGGCGGAALVYLGERATGREIEVESFMGGATKNDLLYRNRFQKYGQLHCSTDDGSYGHHGAVTEILEEVLKDEHFDTVYTCGPEMMMVRVMELCEENDMEMQASLERRMDCGVGLCGSCLLGDLRVCNDGPIFKGETLKKIEEFGKGI